MTGNAACRETILWYNIALPFNPPGTDILSPYRIIAAAAVFLLAACAGPEAEDPSQPLPERVVLHYDFAGDWMATAGDQCVERLNLSETVFLSIATVPNGNRDQYHIADFFMLEQGEPAGALVGTADGDGRLALAVETEGDVDGRRAAIVYALLLAQEGAHTVRLRAFTMTVRDGNGQAAETDLLAEAAADPSIPMLGAMGSRGLCLKRLPQSSGS